MIIYLSIYIYCGIYTYIDVGVCVGARACVCEENITMNPTDIKLVGLICASDSVTKVTYVLRCGVRAGCHGTYSTSLT